MEDLVPDKRDYLAEQESVIDAGSLFVKLNNLFSGRSQELYLEILKNPGQSQAFYGKRLGITQTQVSRLLKSMREDVRRKRIC